jgi:hypothetical protein
MTAGGNGQGRATPESIPRACLYWKDTARFGVQERRGARRQRAFDGLSALQHQVPSAARLSMNAQDVAARVDDVVLVAVNMRPAGAECCAINLR